MAAASIRATGAIRLSLAAFAALAMSPAHAGSEQTPYLKSVQRQVYMLHLEDCKAASFETIRRLSRHGIKARFVVVRTETGGFHAIAVYGEYALDNRRREVTTVAELRAEGYSIGTVTSPN
jgi:hypothetical protein